MSEVVIPPLFIFLINQEQTKAEGYTWYNELTCQPSNLPSSHCPNVTGGEDQIDHIASFIALAGRVELLTLPPIMSLP